MSGSRTTSLPVARGVSGILLAGGFSRRMGRDKAFLEIGREPVVARLLRVLRRCADEVIVVGRSPERFAAFDVPVVPDEIPALGVLGGLVTGLGVMRGEIGVCLGCDMPFVDERLLALLVDAIGDADAAIVRTPKGFEPLCAAYRKSARSALLRMVRRNILAAQQIPRHLDARTVTSEALHEAGIDPRRLFNMNTPEDYATARRWAAELDT